MDEIAVTMRNDDWERVQSILSKKGEDKLLARLQSKAELLTLSWLDKKLAEFP